MDELAINFTGHAVNMTLGQECAKNMIYKAVEEALAFFYILSPSGTTYDKAEMVPNYEVMLIPAIGVLMMLEQIIRMMQRKDITRFSDIVVNTGSAFIFTLTRVFLLTIVINIFTFLHENYRIVDLPLHSVWTWLLSLILVEFVYYWTHRALHEFNILWAAHQFHHMAEDVNITTTIRDSVVDLVIYDIFPLPLAIIVPPQILVVHIQFSLIYQIWLHNSVVGNLGFIEYIINTPRQHRVHHGRNPYCIDKNYGALIMVWDRIFGTHQVETEKIVFGVVSPTPKTFDSMVLQFGYYRDVWRKFNEMKGTDKLWALLKGPGWQPGKPRLGLISDVPDIDPLLPKYSHDPDIPMWRKVYVGLHSFIGFWGFYLLADHPFIKYSAMKAILAMFYIIFTLTSFGAIFDQRSWASILEIFRCGFYFLFDYYVYQTSYWQIIGNTELSVQVMVWTIRLIHVSSIVYWLINCIRGVNESKETYSAASTDVNENKAKDIESNSSSTAAMFGTNSMPTLCLLWFMFTIFTFIAWLTWVLKIDECYEFYNQF